MTNLTDSAISPGVTELDIEVNLVKTRCMGKVSVNMWVGSLIKASITWVKSMEMVFLNGRTGRFMTVVGT
jgi:hypothetical protein